MAETETTERPVRLVKVAVTKAGEPLEFDINTLPDHVYEAAVMEGLKAMVNKGMAKILTKGLEGDKLTEAKAAAMAKAKENLANMVAGKIKAARGSSGKVPGVVMTEAMRLARNLVKAEIKAAKYRISDYDAKEITAAAKAYIESDPSIIEKAKENIEEREKIGAKGKTAFAEIVAKLKINPEKAAKADAKKKEKAPLSAAQAGKVQQRKGKGAQATAH